MEKNIPQLQVKIRSRDQVLYDGTAIAITSKNNKGSFDVLPQHANFISLITDSIVVHINEEKEKSFEIAKGLLKTMNNTVDIYLELTKTPKL
ncbi:hypothetical protein KC573_04015 [candidate division WWE3 bacterium]|uniref:ATP synthase F1 complex delta/epsilon subunit N-terminal domain-containing protein n=1 Tax=candidate division WWE3 bacterium TaxID=2053526 RepID=A0A955LWR7_UNCKA|nr:hypothetical protein [candidate division WWE3 bacterium]